MEQETEIIASVTSRDDSHHLHALMRAQDAIVLAALAHYRMAGFQRPFQPRPGDRFNHLFKAAGALVVPDGGRAHLALCEGLAVVNPARLKPAFLSEVDCIACLDRFTELTRPPKR